MDFGESVNAVINLITAGALAYTVREVRLAVSQLRRHRSEVEDNPDLE